MTRSVPLTMKVPFDGHERHVAHVDVLLLDVLDGAGAGLFVHFEHDQAQRHLERRCERHVALTALVDVVLRLLELVLHEFERGRVGEVGDRENRLENGLKPLIGTPALGLVHEEELIVGGLLDLDQIGHLRDFANGAERLAYLAAAVERGSHTSSCKFLDVSEADVQRPDYQPSGIRTSALFFFIGAR
jgi:hypothetical protein